MGRKPVPEEKRKVRVSFSCDQDVYEAVKDLDLQSMAEWFREAARRRFDADNKKKRKGKKI